MYGTGYRSFPNLTHEFRTDRCLGVFYLSSFSVVVRGFPRVYFQAHVQTDRGEAHTPPSDGTPVCVGPIGGVSSDAYYTYTKQCEAKDITRQA